MLHAMCCNDIVTTCICGNNIVPTHNRCNNVKIKYLLLKRLRNVVTHIFVVTMNEFFWRGLPLFFFFSESVIQVVGDTVSQYQ